MKIQKCLLIAWLVALLLYVFYPLNYLWSEEEGKSHPEKTAMAVRVNPTPPKVDGMLNDEVWQYAPISGDFTQREPNEGEPATEKTTFQIVYDDEALYIGVMCYDSQPDKIVARLTRRDGEVESDWITINLDPHHDHQTGYSFSVNAAGVLQDGQMSNDNGWGETTWDGVWRGKAAIHDKGWSVECRIPYHVLRFSPKEEYIWGINVMRNINRKKEADQWILIRRGESGWISRFGHIEGVKGIHPPSHLEVLPFTAVKTTLKSKKSSNADSHELFGNLGVDLRYGLTSSLSLNATINPDFGQVEADPAELNLSVFETFFGERRPFFIEGSTIFQTPQPDIIGIEGSPQLFYSRRIGKQPGLFSTPKGGTEIERPESTTILGAVKLSGKTGNKTAFGIIEAVTTNEYATIESKTTDPETGLESVQRLDHRIEPLTNFLVGRVQQDVRSNSTVGLTATSMNRYGATPSYASEVDANIKWGENAYSLLTRIAGSRTGMLNERTNGYAAQIHLSRFSGWLGGDLYADANSKEFNVNDLGFMGRANQIQTGAHMYAQRRKPWLLARRSGYNVNLWSKWNYDGLNLAKGINFNNWHQLKNYWFGGFSISREFETMDDLETRGGPPILKPAKTWGMVNLGTDSSKPIFARIFVNFGRSGRNSGSRLRVGSGFGFRPASSVQFNSRPSYGRETNFAQWIRNVDDDGDGKNDHYVFGELESRTLDFTTRADISFSPNLSLQLYLQPFMAVGNYKNIRKLNRPSSYEFTPYAGLNFNPDFKRRSLRGNMVLRWEYNPGSVLFAVWSQSRSASFDDQSFQLWDNLRNSFIDNGQDIFLVKLNYWLGV